LLLDNVSFHKTKEIQEMVNRYNKQLIFNVSYNPDTNPIENVFSVTKNFVRKCTDNHTNLARNITRAFSKIKKIDLVNMFCRSF